MRLDQRIFLFTQLVGLVQHLGGNVHLADVLHQAGEAELFDGRPRQAQELAEDHQMYRDIDRMVVGVLAGRTQAGQPDHGVGIALDAAGHLGHLTADFSEGDRLRIRQRIAQ